MMPPVVDALEARRLLAAAPVEVRADVEPVETKGTILFIRGAERSGGFLEADNDFERTEQLADITNDQTFNGNHGWGALADTLEGHGYTLVQIEEPLEPNAPATGQTTGAALDLASLDLLQYEAVVFGSNNARYDAEHVAVVEDYVRRGGGVLFISDANFGSDWDDAPTSDQPFLDVLGWTMQQDQGTYSLQRNQGDFVLPNHPILTNVDRFDGEGVSPVNLANATVGERIAVAKNQTRNNDKPGFGTSRPVNDDDASLASAELDGGRVVAHFDRNTFFNQNGAGTNINRFDNRQYALNLFDFLAGRLGDERAPEAVGVGVGRVDLETQQQIAFDFDEDVAATVSSGDVVVQNLTTGETVDASRFALASADFGRTVTLTYDVATFGPLPNGQYVAMLAAGAAADRAGNATEEPITVSFRFLTGDSNDDGTVNLADFGVLRGNFGGSGVGRSGGDFNYDGVVNLADFGLLRANFGQSLPPVDPLFDENA
jgi:hypothetical protein